MKFSEWSLNLSLAFSHSLRKMCFKLLEVHTFTVGSNPRSCTTAYHFCGDLSRRLCNHNVLWPQWNQEHKKEPRILISTRNQHWRFTSQCSKFQGFSPQILPAAVFGQLFGSCDCSNYQPFCFNNDIFYVKPFKCIKMTYRPKPHYWWEWTFELSSSMQNITCILLGCRKKVEYMMFRMRGACTVDTGWAFSVVAK